MPAERPLLTIAIPTYNRSRFLGVLLDNLKHQLRDEPRVELLISNNASTDDTRSLIERLCSEGLVATYLQNESNLGADANFLQCFEKSSGKYVWIFSDDDILAADGIKKILAEISKTEYDLIHVSSYYFDEEPRQPDPQNAVVKPPQVFTSGVDFAARVHVFFTFITGNIVNKDKVIASGAANFSRLVGTNLVQLGWTYAALDRSQQSLLIHQRLVGNRANNTGGYALCQIFGATLARLTQELLTDRDCRRVIINGTLSRFLPTHVYSLRAQKDDRSFTKEDPHSVLSQVFSSNFRYWLYIYPVIALPLSLAKMWAILGRILNKIDKTLGSPLLRLP